MSVLGIEKTVSRDIFSERDAKLAKAIRELAQVVECLVVAVAPNIPAVVTGVPRGSGPDG
jgi:hypothetical protein